MSFDMLFFLSIIVYITHIFIAYIAHIFIVYITHSSSNISPSKRVFTPLSFGEGLGVRLFGVRLSIPSFSPFSPSYPPSLPLLYIFP